MGFRSGAYATVWDIRPRTDSVTSLRISISQKKKDSDEYEQTFGGYVTVLGTGQASQAARLHVKDRIRLGDVDVTNRYDKEVNKEYTNFNIFSFEKVGEAGGSEPSYEPTGEAAEFMEEEPGEMPF